MCHCVSVHLLSGLSIGMDMVDGGAMALSLQTLTPMTIHNRQVIEDQLVRSNTLDLDLSLFRTERFQEQLVNFRESTLTHAQSMDAIIPM